MPVENEEDQEDYFANFLDWLERVESKLDYVIERLDQSDALGELRLEEHKLKIRGGVKRREARQ